MRDSGAISPGWFMPISITRKRVSMGAPSSVSGTPRWLLKLLGLACVGPIAAHAASTSRRVVVLPALPVMATHQAFGMRWRHAAAMACSATSASFTSRRGRPCPGTSRSTSAAAAPCFLAASRKSCASKRSPRSATNRRPVRSSRVSVPTPISDSGGESSHRPPVIVAMSAGDRKLTPAPPATPRAPPRDHRRAASRCR